MITIRQMTGEDIQAIAKVRSLAFPRQRASTRWVTSNFNTYPRVLLFIAVDSKGQVCGYIQ